MKHLSALAIALTMLWGMNAHADIVGSIDAFQSTSVHGCAFGEVNTVAPPGTPSYQGWTMSNASPGFEDTYSIAVLMALQGTLAYAPITLLTGQEPGGNNCTGSKPPGMSTAPVYVLKILLGTFH